MKLLRTIMNQEDVDLTAEALGRSAYSGAT